MPDPVRVAHVVQGLETGGAEKLLREFARLADPSRYEPSFVSLSTKGPVAEELEALGRPVWAMGRPSGASPGLVRALARWFRERKIGLVHTHNARALFHGLPAGRLAGAKVVHHRHGQLHGHSRRSLRAFAAWASWADAVACVSEDAARLTLKAGVPSRKVVTVLNGIDVEAFAFRGPSPEGPVVAVGRLSPEKGLDVLVAAMALAPALRLEVAGDGACRSALEEQARALGVADRVAFLGRVDDVPGLLARARLFVLPSRTEGVSLTLLEAMARGLPVVATSVGGTPEVLKDQRGGTTVPSEDPKALADAMAALWEAPERAAELGRAGRARVEEDFTAEKMVRSHERLYDRVLKR